MAQKWHSKYGTPIDCLVFLWFESLRVHHIINPQKCGFFLYSCEFSAFLAYANLAVSCGLFAYMWHSNGTVKYPPPVTEGASLYHTFSDTPSASYKRCFCFVLAPGTALSIAAFFFRLADPEIVFPLSPLSPTIPRAAKYAA